MGRMLLLALATVAASGCSSTSGERMAASLDMPRFLGVSAIDRGDWALAERQLESAPIDERDDPARLMNLGKVYMATDRPELAMATWKRVLRSSQHYDVLLKDGSVSSTDEVARLALKRYRYASR